MKESANSARRSPRFCPGCGVELDPADGPVHRYMEASPACWAKFGELLAREYSDYRYMAVHQLTVDAYAVQHPGHPSQQSIQSVAVHLISLYAVLQRGLSMSHATQWLKRAAEMGTFRWLEPPDDLGELTVIHPLDASTPEEHTRRVRQWARSCWHAWEGHHRQIDAWFARFKT